MREELQRETRRKITFQARMLDKDLKASGSTEWCRNKLKNAIQADWKIEANCEALMLWEKIVEVIRGSHEVMESIGRLSSCKLRNLTKKR